MLINETEFTLPNGKKAVIRSPREEDIESTLDYLRITAGETEFLLRYPEECGKYTYEGEKAFFERANKSPNEAMILCVVEDRVVGVCNIMWSQSIKLRHRASLGIAVIKEYWGQGIATRLMEELFRVAYANEELIQLELDFIEGNSRARALYERLGFRITGMRPNAIRLKDGTLLNEYTMIKELKRA